MEGANEAARRAVNAILDAAKSNLSYCKVWNLQEPVWLYLFRWKDRIRYNKGLPWNGKLPIGVPTISKIAHSIGRLLS
jgi:hypothetical protein